MGHLVLARHGQSVWNACNRFTGLQDVALSPKGEEEARGTASRLCQFEFDLAFTSQLRRTRTTCQIILRTLAQNHIPTTALCGLNERDYGDLSGLDKTQAQKRFGAEQVAAWRRGYEETPPGGESLKQTRVRVDTCYQKNIAPPLKKGKTVLVVAHGNSLRALVMSLENLSPEEISHLYIHTGAPRIYKFFNGRALPAQAAAL